MIPVAGRVGALQFDHDARRTRRSDETRHRGGRTRWPAPARGHAGGIHRWFDQLNNPDAAAGYHRLGEEIWDQTGYQADAFVQAVGTAHSLNGTVAALRRHNPELLVVAAEPAESAVLSGRSQGPHHIEGIDIGFAPPRWKAENVNAIESATTEEAVLMCRRLAREEAIFAGTSTGLNVIAALRVAQRLGAGATVATLGIDSELRYLSTEVFA